MSDQPSIDLCETESVKSDTKSTKSTASISKPTGIKPPSATATARIGRPCCAGHTPKPGIPHQETKSKFTEPLLLLRYAFEFNSSIQNFDSTKNSPIL